MLRSSSSFCWASAVAAPTDFAVLLIRATETESVTKANAAMPLKAIAPIASRMELPRRFRLTSALVDRRLTEYIDADGPFPAPGCRERYRHHASDRTARIEDNPV